MSKKRFGKKTEEVNTPVAENQEEHPLEGLEAIEIEDLGGDKEQKEENEKAKKSGETFGSALSETFGSFGATLKEHKQLLLIISAGIVLIVIASIVASVVTGKARKAEQDALVSANSVSMNGGVEQAILVPTDPLEENAYPEVNALISTYFTAMQNDDKTTIVELRKYLDTVEAVKFDVKSHYVESYQNVVCYTKKGPFEDSYIVYATADVKMFDYDVTAPSLQTILVCTDEAGTLYIYSGDFDEQIANYIKEISSQADVVELISRIDTTYREVMDSNPEFATYMESLNQTIKDEVTEVLATQSIVISEKESGEILVSQNLVDVPEEEEETEETPSEFEVTAVTQVNVRASDSPEADLIGRLYGGQVTTCYEQLANGWSKIAFNDGYGYVKTEFLATAGLTEDDAKEVRTSTDTINVRGSAEVDGPLMGTIYSGASVYVLEDLDSGWTKIIYNGTEAYVKTEYLKK